MNDAISRSNLIKLCRNLVCGTVGPNEIARVPGIDAVHVVRCKDCAKHGGYHCPMFFEEQTYNYDDGYDWIDHDNTTDDGFCHCGIRLEDWVHE